MTEKRFELMSDDEVIIDNCSIADDGGKQTYWTVEYVQREKLVKLLNELHEENQHYKYILQDLGLLMTDEEVIDIRTEMAEEILKPLLKRNGFNVDVDCEHGFKLVPKGD